MSSTEQKTGLAQVAPISGNADTAFRGSLRAQPGTAPSNDPIEGINDDVAVELARYGIDLNYK